MAKCKSNTSIPNIGTNDIKAVIVHYYDCSELVLVRSLSDLPSKIGDESYSLILRLEVLPFKVIM